MQSWMLDDYDEAFGQSLNTRSRAGSGNVEEMDGSVCSTNVSRTHSCGLY